MQTQIDERYCYNLKCLLKNRNEEKIERILSNSERTNSRATVGTGNQVRKNIKFHRKVYNFIFLPYGYIVNNMVNCGIYIKNMFRRMAFKSNQSNLQYDRDTGKELDTNFVSTNNELLSNNTISNEKNRKNRNKRNSNKSTRKNNRKESNEPKGNKIVMPLFVLQPHTHQVFSFIPKYNKIHYIVKSNKATNVFIIDRCNLECFEQDKDYCTYGVTEQRLYHDNIVMLPYITEYNLVIGNLSNETIAVEYELYEK
ncbi:MAG: hypothetical protein PHU54_02600 [Candidatus Omnitrophica bacterium]|nr:hypothetical protein [Candidatus Omnitrophota bacterium]